ncbi:helix-turn-helix transcriptional regulator [Pseudoclavibacter sp. CFCC 11306]|uniref:helix-turn-helix transcriptional regulator n=1 Tax=Pseudoclavibacter sp. CFCC 11306 TaxID=1564493 RepID=UPI0013013D6E|nr:AraC family transcriptional regulator [Pseudoclavibacter sp. CFCC 11306]KAB1657543.1 AraC family transcriptional regulator [Pseudoclavibacter sp. CFCC 11306]
MVSTQTAHPPSRRSIRGTWRREPSTHVRTGTTAAPTEPGSFTILAETEVAHSPQEWAPHSHPHHELVWSHGGTVTARVGDAMFTVSEGCGLWIPAGMVHAGRLTAEVEFHDAFFAAGRTPVAFAEPTVIEMSPLLQALLSHLVSPGLTEEARARAEAVVFDVLRPASRQLTLRLPADDRIAPVAEVLLHDPADGRSLGEWALALNMSVRTLSRAFRASTGLSFGQWRQSLRIHHALALLDEGHDVQRVSARLGYAQPSTFIATFRRLMGVTPGVYVAEKPYSLS